MWLIAAITGVVGFICGVLFTAGRLRREVAFSKMDRDHWFAYATELDMQLMEATNDLRRARRDMESYQAILGELNE